MHTLKISREVVPNTPEAIQFAVDQMNNEIGRRLLDRVSYTNTSNVVSVQTEFEDEGSKTTIHVLVYIDQFRDVLNKLAADYINGREPQFDVESITVAEFCNWVYDELGKESS